MPDYRKIICPHCGYDDVDDIIPEDDSARCPICKKDFDLSDMFDVQDTDEQETVVSDADISKQSRKNDVTRLRVSTAVSDMDIRNPPMGAWICENRNNIIIGAPTTRWDLVFVFLFVAAMLACPVIISVMYNISVQDISIQTAIFENTPVWIIIPFLFFMGLIVVYIISKEGFVIDKNGRGAYHYYGFGKEGTKKENGKQTFEWNSVERIYEKTLKTPATGKHRANIEKFIIIKLKEKTIKYGNDKLYDEISCGSNLSKKRRKYLLDALQYFHKKYTGGDVR